MPAPSNAGFVQTDDDTRLRYAIYGSGEPVILLHGGLGNGDYWSNQIPDLVQEHQLIVIDSRGHGRSTRSARPMSYRLMATDVIAVMDRLAIERADVVGWSDGGIVGLELVLNHPQRLNRLVVFGANYNTAGIRLDVQNNPVDAAYSEKARHDYRALSATPDDYEAFVAGMTAMWKSQPSFSETQLRSIRTPTLVVGGDHDEYIRLDHTLALATIIPDAQLAILPGVSHFALWQDPSAFNRVVADFLTHTCGRGTRANQSSSNQSRLTTGSAATASARSTPMARTDSD